MKRTLFGITAAALLAGTANAAIFEDFEDTNVTYTTNVPEFTDGAGDFFTRTDGSNIGAFYDNISGVQGSGWFAVMDIDGDQAVEPVIQTFTGNITGLTGLELSILIGEEDDTGNEDWDSGDFVHIDYQIDGGGYQNLLWIENDGATFNSAPLIDTNFDGTGDGAEITNVLTEFIAPIAGTGNTLDLRITYQLDSGDEDISIDNVSVTGVPEPTSLALLGLGGLLIARRRRG